MTRWITALLVAVLTGCAGPLSQESPALVPGPDKQGAGTLQGALTGAGAGAVTGFQLGAGTGPGALVGAGLGAVAGGIQGLTEDQSEEQLMALAAALRRERARAAVQAVIQEQYGRRLSLHPTRDIYPADLFFRGGEVRLRRKAIPLVGELARLNKDRVPYSRLVVAVYSKAAEPDSPYALHLANERALEIANYLVRAGLEPRRVVARGIVIPEPLLVDPSDDPLRYNQAVEFIVPDR